MRYVHLTMKCDGCFKEVVHRIEVSEQRDSEGYRTGKLLIDTSLPDGWTEDPYGSGIYCSDHTKI